MSDSKSVGAELDLFANATNWKSYWSKRIGPFLSGDVLEVGAGIGSNTPFFSNCNHGRWVCLEPDPQLSARLRRRLEELGPDNRFEIACGTLDTLAEGRHFDTIVYIDVLEHIEDDIAELNMASNHLRPGGRIIVLSPAHSWLFSKFDAACGHFRRYNRSMFRKMSLQGLSIERLFYLDSAGMIASVANGVLLKQAVPTRTQLRTWDQWMIPVSRVLDKIFLFSVGKSIVAIWRKAP